MNSDVLTALVGVGGTFFTFWFFFMKKEEVVKNKTEIEILVSGGYKPSIIEIKANQRIKLNFLRTDPSDCLEEVVLSDFKIKKYLPMNKKTSIELTPTKKGKFVFSCGMNMNHGKIIVS